MMSTEGIYKLLANAIREAILGTPFEIRGYETGFDEYWYPSGMEFTIRNLRFYVGNPDRLFVERDGKLIGECPDFGGLFNYLTVVLNNSKYATIHSI